MFNPCDIPDCEHKIGESDQSREVIVEFTHFDAVVKIPMRLCAAHSRDLLAGGATAILLSKMAVLKT